MRRPEFIARQAAKPNGLMGRLLVRVMAHETAAFNTEVLVALAPSPGEHVLEVGFGHGHTLGAAALHAPDARFAGIDVSPDAFQVARTHCHALITRGQIDLRIGQSNALPWPDASFDKAFAVHTIYFWREPSSDLRELLRVLRPGGRVVLGFRERSVTATSTFPAEVYRFYSATEVLQLLEASGFGDATIARATSGAGDLRIACARRPTWSSAIASRQ
jgi:ubiquinone/menaquinone biosynthesis C-methylase UbiE